MTEDNVTRAEERSKDKKKVDFLSIHVLPIYFIIYIILLLSFLCSFFLHIQYLGRHPGDIFLLQSLV